MVGREAGAKQLAEAVKAINSEVLNISETLKT